MMEVDNLADRGGPSIHNLGLVGHIEDIVVDKDQQGKKLGLRIIEALNYIAKEVGCYKVCRPPATLKLHGVPPSTNLYPT